MVFPPDPNNNTSLSVNSQEIKKVSSCRYLGAMIDDELKWTDHIQHIYNKLLKYTGIFYKMRAKIPTKILKNIYYAFVYPHLLYAIEVYSNTCPSYLDKLSKLNNKLLRILQNKPLRTSVFDLYLGFNTMPVTLLHEQQLLILAHKIVHSPEILPELFANYLSKNESVHMYNTRTKDDMHLFRASTNYGLRCLKYKIAKLWNELPTELKEEMTIKKFKSILKLTLINRLH